MATDPREATGEWQPKFDLQNVPVHATLLSDGRVLHWGRRKNPWDPNSQSHNSLNEHETFAFIWDPTTGKDTAINSKPKDTKNRDVNLFCAGHTLLPNGNVLVVGGHIEDGKGLKQACIYDPKNDTWTAQDPMNDGRWYPSALTLPDGTVFVASGSHAMPARPGQGVTVLNNVNPQIWLDSDNGWVSTPPTPSMISALYPRLHLDSKGRVFMAGPQDASMFLSFNANPGDPDWGPLKWVDTAVRTAQLDSRKPDFQEGFRNEGSSVMYESGKVLYTGGGGGDGGGDTDQERRENSGRRGMKTVVSIDLNTIDPELKTPKWKSQANMNFRRRHHNATVLPDGTVLVTGGTQGPGFNNLDKDPKGNPKGKPLGPVRKAELWDPATGQWRVLAEEQFDRCYHSIALLLPDGQVLSAGGGEYSPSNFPDGSPNNNGLPNLMQDSLKEAQLFKPPYFFKNGGRRPTIQKFPGEIIYDQDFEVTVGASDTITKISLVRLGSVTHSNNMNQSLMFLNIIKTEGSKITVQAPSNPILAPPGPPPEKVQLAPPGHYMLFALDNFNVPSVAPIVLVKAAATNQSQVQLGILAKQAPQGEKVELVKVDEDIISEENRPDVGVGLTPACPYGLGACWGGAFEGLQNISDVEVVRLIPNQEDSVAYVYTKRDIVPDIEVWRDQFQSVANGSYALRGIEITFSGMVTRKAIGSKDQFVIVDDSNKAEVVLAQLQEGSKIQWDKALRQPKSSTAEEAGAFVRLSEAVTQHEEGLNLEVTGPVKKSEAGSFSLEVREWKVTVSS